MPDHVEHPANAENDHAEQRDSIARRKCLQPGITFAPIQQQVHTKKQTNQNQPSIENRVPRCEESIVHLSMVMRPAIKIGATDKHNEYNSCHPVKSRSAKDGMLLCRRFNRLCFSLCQ